MEEPFSFSPVDKIPAKPGNYKARPLEKWNWLDFYNYFDDSHAQMVGKAPWLSMKEKGKKKKIIEDSFNYWGKETFKVMIDWVFPNYRSYPEWKVIHIGLVCGTHPWARMIGEQALKLIRLDKK